MAVELGTLYTLAGEQVLSVPTGLKDDGSHTGFLEIPYGIQVQVMGQTEAAVRQMNKVLVLPWLRCVITLSTIDPTLLGKEFYIGESPFAQLFNKDES
ncbi:hypothetical protein C5B42_00410 [Candidatus Cerribacteria bacterium 'Amazon FNV 2010 28 9']|uniref:Uncharacterized protein n=1 Tax=Candidatus Cerribacteria bacterium 'Amazon FNV 2010 28 9' TaxID=2081795 RepID=A0A317JR20_9BACT|nr:MAG: hypothetical protein C5B42_00410 [Candidatus Cerribacteria bacterium 'Amazon FNV 2010 28 9']